MLLAFDLVVRTPQGVLRSMQLNAADAASARAAAARDGLQVLGCSLHEASSKAASKATGARRALRSGRLDITTWSQELASLLAAGLSVVDSLRTLAANAHAGPQRVLLMSVVDAVCEGLPLSAALSRHADRFPMLLIATVSASEQTGDLSTALRRYAEHQAGIRALRDKVVGACIYPLLLLGVGSLVVLFLLGVVVPKFATLIESAHRELPWSSQLLMSWGQMVANNASAIAIGAAIGALLLVVAVRRLWRDGARAAWVESVPVIGATVRLFRHAQLYRTTGMLVKGGITAPRALQLAANLLGNDDRARLDRAVTMVHEGRSLSSALQEVQLADPVASSMLTVAERTGALAEILERVALFHESRLQRSVELTSRLFEPLLMIVIGLVIGAIVVLMYLPIFDLASSLQ